MTAGEFRNGVTFEMDGQVQQVIEFQHVKPGKGAAFVRVKMKNVVTGAVTETSFNPTAKFEEAFVERREMQYLYNEGDLYYFMDNDTFDQIPLYHDQVEEALKYLRENDEATIKFYKGAPFLVEAPQFVDLVITDTEPGFAGNTAQGALKPATVETGLVIQVPLFIESGEKVQIDTRTGEYLGRSKE